MVEYLLWSILIYGLKKCEISGKKVGFEQIYEDFENYKNSLGEGVQKYLCDND